LLVHYMSERIRFNFPDLYKSIYFFSPTDSEGVDFKTQFARACLEMKNTIEAIVHREYLALALRLETFVQRTVQRDVAALGRFAEETNAFYHIRQSDYETPNPPVFMTELGLDLSSATGIIRDYKASLEKDKKEALRSYIWTQIDQSMKKEAVRLGEMFVTYYTTMYENVVNEQRTHISRTLEETFVRLTETTYDASQTEMMQRIESSLAHTLERMRNNG
ncbi:MAG: hypothetical protein ACRC5C_07245, partial [Bacilli bacterium]